MPLAKRKSKIKRVQCLAGRPADMITCNRAQMAVAIRCVPCDCDTVIEAIDKAGKVLVRYSFPHRLTHQDRVQHEKHITKLACQVMKTPANIWR